MGKINVKLSNNYFEGVDAAQTYYAVNTVKEISIPDVVPGSWQLLEDVNYQNGFGVYAKLATPVDDSISLKNYVVFVVCFLKNQQIGVNEIYNKVLDNQESSGKITMRYRELIAGGQFKRYSDYLGAPAPLKPLLKERSLYLRPALLAVEKLNDLSQADSFDVDWVYGNSMWTDQENFFVDNLSFATPTTYRTGKRTENDFPGSTDPTMVQGGAYGDNPWPKDGMQSFFNAGIWFEETPGAANERANEEISQCSDEQESLWNDQWEKINQGGGGPS